MILAFLQQQADPDNFAVILEGLGVPEVIAVIISAGVFVAALGFVSWAVYQVWRFVE